MNTAVGTFGTSCARRSSSSRISTKSYAAPRLRRPRVNGLEPSPDGAVTRAGRSMFFGSLGIAQERLERRHHRCQHADQPDKNPNQRGHTGRNHRKERCGSNHWRDRNHGDAESAVALAKQIGHVGVIVLFVQFLAVICRRAPSSKDLLCCNISSKHAFTKPLMNKRFQTLTARIARKGRLPPVGRDRCRMEEGHEV